MTEFLAILAFYYMCDYAAVSRPPTGAELAACTQAYEQIKTHFIADPELAAPGTAARVAQNRAGYAGFKAWEAGNPALVADLRREAADAVDKVRAAALPAY